MCEIRGPEDPFLKLIQGEKLDGATLILVSKDGEERKYKVKGLTMTITPEENDADAT